jgi:hypothetical protein
LGREELWHLSSWIANQNALQVDRHAADHSVRISHKGYQPYEKQIHVSGGKISLRAELEPVKE